MVIIPAVKVVGKKCVYLGGLNPLLHHVFSRFNTDRPCNRKNKQNIIYIASRSKKTDLFAMHIQLNTV